MRTSIECDAAARLDPGDRHCQIQGEDRIAAACGERLAECAGPNDRGGLGQGKREDPLQQADRHSRGRLLRCRRRLSELQVQYLFWDCFENELHSHAADASFGADQRDTSAGASHQRESIAFEPRLTPLQIAASRCLRDLQFQVELLEGHHVRRFPQQCREENPRPFRRGIHPRHLWQGPDAGRDSRTNIGCGSDEQALAPFACQLSTALLEKPLDLVESITDDALAQSEV